MSEETVKHEFTVGYDYTEDVDPQKIKEVAKMGFGHGTNVVSDIGNKQAPILDFDRLDAENLIDYDTYADFRKIDYSGSSFHEATESVNKNFALGGKSGIVFNNTLQVSTSNQTNNMDNYEYCAKGLLSKVFGAYLNPCDTKKYLLKDASNYLNGIPSSDGKPKYPTTEEGIKKLFDTYGTHLMTKAIFGTRYEYLYLRENTEKSTKAKTQTECNLGQKFGSDPKGLQLLEINPSASYDQEYSECTKNAFGIAIEKRMGGDQSPDISNWQASCNFNMPYTIALIGYVFSPNEVDNGLVPIWDLVDDPVRAAKMEEVYKVYVQEHTPTLKKGRAIVVDVYGKYFSKNETAPNWMYMNDFNGTLRKYYKVDDNILKHLKGSTKGSFYFYYALGYSGNGGITEVKFVKEDEPDGSVWLRRGDNAKSGVTGIIDKNVVAIRKASNESESELVTGFGLKIKGNVSKVSQGTTTAFPWTQNGNNWFHGLCHDDVYCLYTKNTLEGM